jgi:hypothetical protein
VKRVLLALIASSWMAAPAFAGAIRFEEQKIVGKIQKPEIQILITRQNLTPKYELELKESFLPKVIESVEHKPF